MCNKLERGIFREKNLPRIYNGPIRSLYSLFYACIPKRLDRVLNKRSQLVVLYIPFWQPWIPVKRNKKAEHMSNLSFFSSTISSFRDQIWLNLSDSWQPLKVRADESLIIIIKIIFRRCFVRIKTLFIRATSEPERLTDLTYRVS